ncbi:MAG: 1-acyl-sn-glycerol-3-phosphate acyltransferase, partial [Desulfatiglans sp.]|nr:1-acyl-sn-glycerol-3-phosphate acyltransferase [Desulfatiglans sp.]
FIVLINLTVFPLLILMTIIGIIVAPFAFIFFKLFGNLDTVKIIRYFVWIYGKGWLAIIKPFTGLTTSGFKRGEIPTPCIIVLNHLSFFDTFFMGVLPFSNVCFALRSWPFKMAWYRPFMRAAQYLDVERLSYDETFTASRNLLDNGGVLLLFPEAHRSRDGRMGRFYSGAFKISIATNYPIVPLCITGTDELLPPGRWYLKPAKVKIKALSPVYPDAFTGENGHIEMRKHVKALIASEVERMR